MQEMQIQSLGQKDPFEKEMGSLQYSCLQNSMDRGAWRTTVHGITKELDRAQQLTTTACLLSR